MHISNIVKKVKMLPHFPESLYQILVVQTYANILNYRPIEKFAPFFQLQVVNAENQRSSGHDQGAPNTSCKTVLVIFDFFPAFIFPCLNSLLPTNLSKQIISV